MRILLHEGQISWNFITALRPLYGSLSLYGPLPPPVLLSSLQPSILSTALFHLCGHLSPLRPSVPLMALCPLYCPLSPLRPSVPSMVLGLLYGTPPPLWTSTPLRHSIPFTAICLLYGPQTPTKCVLFSLFREMMPLFREIAKRVSRNILRDRFVKNSIRRSKEHLCEYPTQIIRITST